MSVNNFRPHLLVLPEDNANGRLADGFLLELQAARQMDVLPAVGGWTVLLEQFKSTHMRRLDRYPERMMILLLDFDGREERLTYAKTAIPDHLLNRVFILGVWTEPENLKRDLGDYESIGRALARDCRDGTDTTWGHELLRHNAGELDRMREPVREILFPSALH